MSPPEPSPPPVGVSGRRTERRVEGLLALVIALLSVPVLQAWSAQPASRYLFTAAVWDDGTIYLDRYEGALRIDRAEVDGHVVSDKAPYQPMLGVPAYALYRLVGGDPAPTAIPDEPHLGVWWVSLWTVTVPAVALAILMRRLVRRVHPALATRVALALALGTVLLPFASLMFGHILAAVGVFGGWLILREGERSAAQLLGAGLLLAVGVGAEFPVAAIVAVVMVFSLPLHRWRLGFTCAGGVVGGLPLVLFNWSVFGGPFSTAYQGHLPNFQGEGALGVYNLRVPVPREVYRAILGDRGLLLLTPVMLLALLGCAVAIRQRSEVRRDAVLASVLLVVFLVLTTGIDGVGGWVPGPRYLIPVIPFFAVPLAEAWTRWPRACVATAWIGGFFMALATVTDPLVPESVTDSPRRWLRQLAAGEFGESLPGQVAPEWTILLFVAAALAVLHHLLTLDRALRRPAARAEPVTSL